MDLNKLKFFLLSDFGALLTCYVVFMLDMVERRVPIPIDDMIAKSIGYVGK